MRDRSQENRNTGRNGKLIDRLRTFLLYILKTGFYRILQLCLVKFSSNNLAYLNTIITINIKFEALYMIIILIHISTVILKGEIGAWLVST